MASKRELVNTALNLLRAKVRLDADDLALHRKMFEEMSEEDLHEYVASYGLKKEEENDPEDWDDECEIIEIEPFEYSPSAPWYAPGMRASDFVRGGV